MTIDIGLINHGLAHCKVFPFAWADTCDKGWSKWSTRPWCGANLVFGLHDNPLVNQHESLMSPQHPAMNVMQFTRSWRPPRHPLCWILIQMIEVVPRLLQQRISLEEKRRDQAIEQLTTFMTDAINTVSNRMEEPWLQLTETFWIFLNYVRWRECILR